MSIKQQQRNKKDKRLFQTYGLSLVEYEILYSGCKGCCEICGRSYKVLNVDHRHVKGYKKFSPEEKRREIRGLLCMRCNKFTLGSLEIHKNAREILENLNRYASRYKLKGDV